MLGVIYCYRNRIRDLSSNPDKTVFYRTLLPFAKVWIHLFSPPPPAIGKSLGQTGFFIFGWATYLRKTSFKPALHYLTNWLCITSCLWMRGWVNIYISEWPLNFIRCSLYTWSAENNYQFNFKIILKLVGMSLKNTKQIIYKVIRKHFNLTMLVKQTFGKNIVIHCELCQRLKFDHVGIWCMHKFASIQENEMH